MTSRPMSGWVLWFVVLALVACQAAISGAGTPEEDRALLVEWLTGELVVREEVSYIDKYVGAEIVVDGLDEPALWVRETYDGIGYELYGDRIKDWVKIRSFGSAESEDLPKRMLENVGLSTYGVRTFSLDPESGSILMRAWYPTPDARNSLDEKPEATEMRHIGVASLTEYEGCATRFRRQGDEFIGAPAEGPCTFNIKGGTKGIERRWRVTAGAFDVNMLYLNLDSQDAGAARLSALYRCEYFELRLVDLSQRAIGSTFGSVERIHDQNGSVTYGPVSLEGEFRQDAYGTGAPKFEVKLDRDSNGRVMTGTRVWDDGSTEEAFSVRIPLDAEEIAVEVAKARLEMRTARPRGSDLNEVACLFPGEYSNRAHIDGNLKGEVVLHVAPIWTHRTGYRWFYVEMAIAATPDEPILQRVVEMGPGRNPWTVRWFVHKLDDPEILVGLWRNPEDFDHFPHTRLAPSPCERGFEKRGGTWISTPNRLCAADPVETFTWLLTPNQITLKEFTYSPTGDPKIPRQLVRLDRLEDGPQ